MRPVSRHWTSSRCRGNRRSVWCQHSCANCLYGCFRDGSLVPVGTAPGSYGRRWLLWGQEPLPAGHQYGKTPQASFSSDRNSADLSPAGTQRHLAWFTNQHTIHIRPISECERVCLDKCGGWKQLSFNSSAVWITDSICTIQDIYYIMNNCWTL